MRTTLSLDPDVAALIEKARRSRKEKLRTIVNEALRRGLTELLGPPRTKKRFRTKPFDAGRCLVGSLDDVSEVLLQAEGEAFR
jgi:hypothetical protein